MKQALRQAEQLDEYVTVGQFFNARGAALEKTPLGLLRPLLHQINVQIPSLLSKFLPKFRIKCELYGIPKDWAWELEELQEFLLQAFDEQQTCPVSLFVDALDECDEEQGRKMVSFVATLIASAQSNNSVLNVCISSRYYSTIQINGWVVIKTEDYNKPDITTYVKNRFPASDGQPDRVEFQQTIIDKASGVILWVVLVLELLIKAEDDGESTFARQELVRQVPAKLRELLHNLLQKSTGEERQRTCQIMQLVFAQERPLTCEELYHAMAFSATTPHPPIAAWESSGDFISNDTQREKLIRSCSKGLIEVKHVLQGRCLVQFIHESVRSFLIHNKGFATLNLSLSSYVLERCHDLWMRTCVNYLALREPTSWIPADRDYIPEGARARELDPNTTLPLFNYSLRSLFRHAEVAESPNLPEQQFIRYFRSPENNIRFKSFNFYSRCKNVGIWVEGTTFFHKACELGLINSVAELLRQGSDIVVQNDVGHTPLFVAAGNGRLAVLHLLLKEPSLRADILVAGYSPPIKIAVSKGHGEIVRLLLQRDDAAPNTTGGHDTPLNDATKKGRKDIVKLLLDWKDINVDATDKEGQTPLWWAYDRGRHDDRDRRDIVQMLLNKEASVRKLPRGHPLRAGQSEADEDDEVEENSHITTPSNATPETPNRAKSRSPFRKHLGRLFGRRP